MNESIIYSPNKNEHNIMTVNNMLADRQKKHKAHRAGHPW